MDENILNNLPIDDNAFEINKKLELVIDDSTKYMATIKSKASKLLNLYTYEVKETLNLNRGDILKYFLCLNDQLNIDFYGCYSKVNQIADSNNGLKISISYPQKIEKLGIRRFYRMPIKMPVLYSFINVIDHYNSIYEVPYIYFLKMHEATTVDISGCGLKFVTEELCRKGQEIVLELPHLNNIRLHGIIEWIELDKINNNTKIALSYKNINASDQDKLINFIFDKLREARSRL